jgi:hypothetical protein
MTNLLTTVNAWQIQGLYRQRADTEKGFDEPTNQGVFSDIAAKSRATTELPAQLLQLAYNLWMLFVRLILPLKHTYTKRDRR